MDLFSSTLSGESYKTNHYFNCENKWLVYLVTCQTYKLQVTGQVCHAFWKRWNNHITVMR